MASIREWLNGEGFDWDRGTVIVHDICERYGCRPYPGWAYGTDDIGARRIVSADDPILDHSFHEGSGGPECPRFVAFDDGRMMFPEQYDGSTELVVVHTDPAHYLTDDSMTPYPGG